MAYGKNKSRKDWLMRAVPLGVGKLSPQKRDHIFTLRSKVLALMQEMANSAFSQEPLLSILDSKEIDARLLLVQTACTEINSVWREQARMRVKPALDQANKRYLARLSGSLRFVDAPIPKEEIKARAASLSPEQLILPQRRYFQVPVEVQDTITPAELLELKEAGQDGLGLALFRRVIIRKDHSSLSAAQVATLQDIHTRAQQKHHCPDFGGDDFTLQLHIDARMVASDQSCEALQMRGAVAFLLKDDKNKLYRRFIDIAGLKARQERIRLPLSMSTSIARRISHTRSEWASLIVEMSPTTLGVRLVTGKPQDPAPTHLNAFVGRDFGYANTVSLCVALTNEDVELGALRQDLSALATQDDAKAYLLDCRMNVEPKIAERIRFSGKPFLRQVHALSTRIDGYKSRIDVAYQRLHALKGCVVRDLGLAADAWLDGQTKRQHKDAQAFFAARGLIADLKKARRVLYRKIVALKKNWFGFLSNVELSLAKKYNAAIVREDLTVLAIENDSPGYKGRVFNKMINHGSKGQYQKRATDKFLFNGVPEIVVPSWYTSRVCLTHNQIMDARQRKGESIYLSCCQKHDHADEHAAQTIAMYPLLRKQKLTAG